MNTEIILNFLENLGQQITATGQQAFEIYVRQAYIQGIANFTTSGIFLVIFLLCIFGIIKFGKLRKAKIEAEEYDFRNIEPVGVGLMFSWMFLVISFMIFTGTFIVGLKEILNPQYYALQDIMTTLNNTMN